MSISAFIYFFYFALATALPSPKDAVHTDPTMSHGNSSSGGNSTANFTVPTKGGIKLSADAAAIFKDNQALLKDQEAKAKQTENGDLLESVSGGWWDDIEAEYVWHLSLKSHC